MQHLLCGEFIPWWMLYPPVVIYGIYLSIKYRSLTLPTIANPGIYTGGAFGESKFELSRELFRVSPDFAAKTGLIEGCSVGERLVSLQKTMSALQVDFPVILKPDIGQGGLAVEIVRNAEQAREYLDRFMGKILLQEFVRGPYEAGIYYCRFPGREKGSILDITDKRFPVVIGDGQQSIQDLILRDPRARLFASHYLEQLGPLARRILSRDETYRICSRGNWVQGCMFLDGMRLWSPELEQRIDSISRGVSGFFIGRYDLRYDCEEDLISGRAFKIVELNGITAIPTSLKDPKTSVWHAWGLLCYIMGCLFEVGARNMARGHNPMPVGKLVKAVTDFKNVMNMMSRKSQ